MANQLPRLCLKMEIFVKVDCVRNKAYAGELRNWGAGELEKMNYAL